MRILGIETSCDDTAVSIIETDGTTLTVLGNTVHSQIELHRPYGGVFPTLAKREHQRNLIPTLEKTLTEARSLKKSTTKNHSSVLQNTRMILERETELLKAFEEFIPTIEKPNIDAIAVTQGPGLEPALWVGINFAKALSLAWNIPVIPVNHMEGHVLVSLLKKESDSKYLLSKPSTPALALLISGGHTEMVLMKDVGDYEIIGKTRDDAVGECFDKVARLMNLPYPGGPEISRLASRARTENIVSPFPLPRPMTHSGDLDFSFSGLKTAVRYAIEKVPELTADIMAGVSREFEDAITDVFILKLGKAHDEHLYQSLIVGGGVIANITIRKSLEEFSKKRGITLYLPAVDHSTDNALMISIAGYFKLVGGAKSNTIFKADGNFSINS
jgi:N6-L-threonylcarbamoyladenine synthase